MLEYHITNKLKKKVGFFPSSKVQTNRQIAHVHKDLPLPTSSTAITKKPPTKTIKYNIRHTVYSNKSFDFNHFTPTV